MIRFRHPIVVRIPDLPQPTATSLASATARPQHGTDQWADDRAPLRRLQDSAPTTLRTRVTDQLRAIASPQRW